MDKAKMQECIEVMLIPWKEVQDTDNLDVWPPIIILDAYLLHKMGSVLNKLRSIRFEVLHITRGCTYLCQPIDVRINKQISYDCMRSGRNG
jgi:hypothetical protein